MFDCARANKAMSAWGVEARVPFLDKDFLDIAMSINPELKECKDGKMETIKEMRGNPDSELKRIANSSIEELENEV